VFAKGAAPRPKAVTSATGARAAADGRRARVTWTPAANAEFYIVRVGPRPDLLTQTFQVYDGKTSLDLASLTTGVTYVFAVDAVNESGVTKGKIVGSIP
jgi:hypothetical protein